jgi:hypothetical protein
MQIGDRYLGLGDALFMVFPAIGTLVFLSWLVSGGPFFALVVSAVFFIGLCGSILRLRCPYCKEFFTGKKIESSSITEDVTEHTYSCVNCGEKWTQEIGMSDSDPVDHHWWG